MQIKEWPIFPSSEIIIATSNGSVYTLLQPYRIDEVMDVGEFYTTLKTFELINVYVTFNWYHQV